MLDFAAERFYGANGGEGVTQGVWRGGGVKSIGEDYPEPVVFGFLGLSRSMKTILFWT